MDKSYQSAWWLERVKALPDALVRARPVLSMSYAWGLLNGGELEAGEVRMRDLERWLEARTTTGESTRAAAEMVVVDEERLRSLPAELARARVYLAQSLGSTSASVEEARRSLDLIPEGDDHARAMGIALLALALWANGDLDAAHRTFSEALATMRRAGLILDVIRGIFVLGDLRVAQGRLQDAKRTYQQGLDLAAEQPDPSVPETDELYLGLGELHREWGDLEAAERLLLPLTEAPALTEQRGNTQRLCIVMARIGEARWDLDGALELLDEAEGIHIRDPLPRVRPVAAMKARVWVLQGRLDDAMGWVRARGLSVTEELSFVREFEHITLTRVLIARHGTEGARSVRDAVELLERITTAARAGGRTGSVIEAQVLLAVAHQTLVDARGALAPLERALTLAEPEGYVRVFVDEGVRMRDLLRQAAARGIGGEYVRRLLAAFDAPAQPAAASAAQAARAAASPRSASAGLAQPLTARELEILRLIAAGLRNQEIARQLFISQATVKRHIANAYLKLGVGHRTEALVRAKEMKLL
jgi:LuxR family maltose regulon positive regulatory protein